MSKEELLKLLRALIFEWITVTEVAGRPFEDKKYVSLHPDVIPKDQDIPDTDDTHIAVYNTVFEKYEVIDISDPVSYHIGVNFNGTVDPKFSFGNIIAGEDVPDLTEYMEYITDKVNTFKYRLNSVLSVAVQEWDGSTVYELIDIGKNEFNYDVAHLAGQSNDKEKIIEKFRSIFIRNTMGGYTTLTEHRMNTTTKLLESIGVDPKDVGSNDVDVVGNVRQVWMSVIKKYRDKALVALDREEDLAREDDDDQGVEEIGFIKQMLRDLPEEIGNLEDMNTVTDIVEFWPPILLPRPTDHDFKPVVTA